MHSVGLSLVKQRSHQWKKRLAILNDLVEIFKLKKSSWKNIFRAISNNLSNINGRVDWGSDILDEVGPHNVLFSGQEVNFNLGHNGAPDVIVFGSITGREAPVIEKDGYF